MKKVLLLIDEISYIKNNCFQHQLFSSLSKNNCLTPLSIRDINNGVKIDVNQYDSIVSLLKQRTLYRNVSSVSNLLKSNKLIAYDQDPWEAFRDGSEFKGSYKTISSSLNVTFAVTSKWWSDYINGIGMKSIFVKMWLLPEYCDNDCDYVNRNVDMGFIGTVHPYRKKLFDELKKSNKTVSIHSPLGYNGFLKTLSTFKIFIHSEDIPITIDNEPANIGTGLWIKDIEAAGRGAFSIRNRSDSFESYITDDLPSIKLYDSKDHLLNILNDIESMDIDERQNLINTSVKNIKIYNCWQETSDMLTM